MYSWVRRYERLLASPKQHIILRDPDNIVSYPELREYLIQKGYIIKKYKTGLALRIDFELTIRASNENHILILTTGDIRVLADIRYYAEEKKITLHDLLGRFHPRAIKGLSSDQMDRLTRLSDSTYKTFDFGQTRELVVRDRGYDRADFEYDCDQANALIRQVEKKILSISRPEDWFEIIRPLGKIKKTELKTGGYDDRTGFSEKINALEHRVNERFQIFIEKQYRGLVHRSPYIRPYLVSHLIQFIRHRHKRADKLALIVLDGMNYWQWLIIEEALGEKGIPCETSACFSWIPSITAFSRQAIFKGDRPDMSADNQKEDALWFSYWKKQGISGPFILYCRTGVNSATPKTQEISDTYKRVAMVCNDLDEMMHSALMGNVQLFHNTCFWLKQGHFFVRLIRRLKRSGYDIYIASDHGSIQAKGSRNLKMSEKFGSLSRGRRFIRFANHGLLDAFIQKNKDAFVYHATGNALYLKDDRAFTNSGESRVTHGGSHFWEVIVPFVHI